MKVTFDNVYNAFQIIAPKGTMISFTGEPTALADGVYLVGDDGIINLDEQFLTDTLYLSTEGTDYTVTGGMRVTYPLGDETVIIRAGSSTIPFSKGGKGGGGSGGDNTHYKGTTTTPISNGSTTNPITIDGEEYTAVFGDIVVYGYTEFVFDGTTWSEFGRPFDTTPTSGSANAVTSDGIYKRTVGTGRFGMYMTCYDFGIRNTQAASDFHSHMFGQHLKTWNSGRSVAEIGGQVCIGRYNIGKNNYQLIIGNGTDEQNRSNIFEVSDTFANVNGDIQRNGVGIDDYTTTERKIGKWIDGSDLYQRTFEVTASSVNGWNDNILGTSGIKIVDVQGFIYGWYEDTYLSKPLVYYRSATDYITVLYDDDVNVYIIDPVVSTSPMPTLTITIKYTKISAQAFSQSYQIPSDNPFNISVTEASETPTVEEDDMR